MLGNKTYDFFKRLVQVGFPAISALYFGLGQIWGFPEIENVVGVIDFGELDQLGERRRRPELAGAR